GKMPSNPYTSFLPRRHRNGQLTADGALRKPPHLFEKEYRMKTFAATPRDIKKEWLVIDADDVVLGRLASYVAKLLRGKHKPIFTPNMDTGDNVIIVNAGKVKLTGRKRGKKVYYHHTGFPGGIKERSAEHI